MKRELKFRAWDGEQMHVLTNSGLQYYDFEGSYSLGFTVDGYSGFWGHEQYESATKKASQFPIMQYTGLKDKNGKEVYEGDVIRVTYFNEATVYVVLWHDAGFRCFYPRDTFDMDNPVDIVEHVILEGGVVIGNIYETPELL